MDLYTVMRTAFAAREFTPDPIDDATLYRLLENARFAPSGGNRQGWRVIVIRDPATKAAIAESAIPAARRYAAQVAAGENPWNTAVPSSVPPAQIDATPVPPVLVEPYRRAPVLLAVCVDLSVVASLDAELPRVGIASGASIYPFAWNILLTARNEGLGGTLTTLPIAREPDLQALLHLPSHIAVATIINLGHPARRLTRLKRKPVEAFATLEHFDGPPLARPS
jgi:nitroreductase